MSIRKSLDDQLMVDLLVRLVYDVTLLCDSDLHDFQRDAETIEKRVHCEGFGFLSKRLPLLGKAVDKSLKTGTLEVPPGFRTGRNSKIPVFLRGIFRCVYSEDGSLRSDHESMYHFEGLRGLRQILYLFYKVETEYDDSCIHDFLTNFVETDRLLPDKVELDETIWIASLLLEQLLNDFDPRGIVPRHGPGAVSTGERGSSKYLFRRKYSKIHSFYPYYDYFTAGRGPEIKDRRDWYCGLEKPEFALSKTILVPKDSRGPRLISAEPLEFQWIQQGLGRALVGHVERHPLTRGYVNFTDQGVNQSLARSSSHDGRFATLDMKDASDRVSLALVRALFPEPLLEALEASRSDATRLPTGEVVFLKKFAPMGSALCFPVEALVFWSIAVAVCIQLEPGGKLNRPCYVYGDDIVVPVHAANSIIAAYERYSLKVNEDKCYITGPFRESCGVDAYHGFDVTPLKLRHPIWEMDFNNRNVMYPHAVSAINSLLMRGYWQSADLLRRWIEDRMGFIPYGTSNSGYPCILLQNAETAEAVNLLLSPHQYRWNIGLQRFEFKFLIVKTFGKHDHSFDGWPRLLRAFVSPAATAPTFFPVNRSTGLVPRWVPV